ncbi:MAG: phosphate/phosphite/phosphonate ABC transporter substrate-binding protein, partial [Desulfobulbaceae bacterium]|nr:phosphate/phosphite/phosphonate ABC transporter substrate-binding protein [Desulfobulbaceae bacterium]
MKKLATLLVMASLFLFGCNQESQQHGDSQAVKESEKKVTIDETNPVKIGFMVCNSPLETTGRFAPIAQYLSERTGKRFEFIIANTHEFEDLVRDKKIDFFHGNSLLAITFKEKYGMEFLAVDKRGRNGYKSTGTIIALKSSGIKTY